MTQQIAVAYIFILQFFSLFDGLDLISGHRVIEEVSFCLVHMSNMWICIVGLVRPAILCGKNLNIEHSLKTLLQNLFMLAMVTFTLTGSQMVSAKQKLLASCYCTCLN